MSEQNTENMRTMAQMRDRCPIENAVYAMGSLSNYDKVKAAEMFNEIFGDPTRPRYTTIEIQFTGYDK